MLPGSKQVLTGTLEKFLLKGLFELKAMFDLKTILSHPFLFEA